ncbi:membrane metalloprotease [Tamlana crocina]|uniref:Membrane metalloprotease n=1 Tax=Tamlana crocina TaxID=393006 RepID=A0ABX1DJR0_9FLAO|nr:membrane metalloprotease [Tamlana crocina]NJX16546.1 membrane metalloprotease [Tamlana crocina]
MLRTLKISLILLTLIGFLQGCTKDQNSENQEDTINVNANKQATGSSSNDLLSSNTFSRMEIQLAYVKGFEPTQAAINNFVSFLEARTHKPNGISVEKIEIPSPGIDQLSIDDIADIENTYRTKYNNGNTIAVWALFVDGESDKNDGNNVVLGSAYWNTSFVIYEETLREFSNSPVEPSRSASETTVINHEFGHILGLTNLGAPLQSDHEDDEHPKHCDNSDCLMYWEAESGAAVSNMVNSGSAPQLGPECIADLKANGGK